MMVAVYYAFLRQPALQPVRPRALAGIRVNEHRMRAMGFGTFQLQAGGVHARRRPRRACGLLCGARRQAIVNPGADGVPHERARDHDGHPRRHGQLRGRDRGCIRIRDICSHEFKSLPAQVGSASTLGKHWQLWMGHLHRRPSSSSRRVASSACWSACMNRRKDTHDWLKSCCQRARTRHQALWRPRGGERGIARPLARSHPRRDRPQWRGQVHVDATCSPATSFHPHPEAYQWAGRRRDGLEARNASRVPRTGPQLPERPTSSCHSRCMGERAAGSAVPSRRKRPGG